MEEEPWRIEVPVDMRPVPSLGDNAQFLLFVSPEIDTSLGVFVSKRLSRGCITA